MINQITCNSNNAIEMSRGELLQWLNTLLKLNYTKIQQMGTGAAYCQILDIIYPNKVPLSKVNWKAKFDYEYLNNFKVLQQSFTKLNIMKHIDVEKLVKCKYQDNLEFLQWFKKIYDVSCSGKPSGAGYDPQARRGQQSVMANTNQNLLAVPNQKQKLCISQYSNSFSEVQSQEKQNQQNHLQSRFETEKKSKYLEIPSHSKEKSVRKQKVTLSTEKLRYEEKFLLQNLYRQGDKEQYLGLRKIKEIEHLMETWKGTSSSDLAREIKKILMASEDENWKIEEGLLVKVANQACEQ